MWATKLDERMKRRFAVGKMANLWVDGMDIKRCFF